MQISRLTGISAPFTGMSFGASGGNLQPQLLYGGARIDSPGLIGVMLLTLQWHDGLSMRSRTFPSLSVLSGSTIAFNESFIHDYNAMVSGPTLDLAFVGVLGSPSCSLSFVIDP